MQKIEKTYRFSTHAEEARRLDEYYRSLEPNERVKLVMQMMEDWNGADFKRLERTCRFTPLSQG